MQFVENLLTDSVVHLDKVLTQAAKWVPPPQQKRRELPQSWRERYKLEVRQPK